MTTLVKHNYCVIGAGHGGQALAAYIAYLGNPTIIYNRTKTVVDQINSMGGIQLHGMIESMVKDIHATHRLKEALDASELIMVCIPAHAHEEIAELMAPYLQAHHKVIINPGRTLGAFLFKKYLSAAGCDLDIPICETDTFVLTSRRVRPGVSHIFSRKKKLRVAALNPSHNEEVYKALKPSFNMVCMEESIIITSLSNIGMLFHPFPALMNLARIECGDNYLHYKEGITPLVSNFIEKLDDERLALARSFGYVLPSAFEWLDIVYGSQGESLYLRLQDTHQYDEIGSPGDITTRYIYEDIPTGIVPMLELAKLANTPHKHLEIVLNLANSLYSIDFSIIGRHDVKAFFESYYKS